MINTMPANSNEIYVEIPLYSAEHVQEAKTKNQERLEKIDLCISNVTKAFEQNNLSIKLLKKDIEIREKLILKAEEAMSAVQSKLEKLADSKKSSVKKKIKKMEKTVKKYKSSIADWKDTIESKRKQIVSLEESNFNIEASLKDFAILKISFNK